jgi:hypothetical protein
MSVSKIFYTRYQIQAIKVILPVQLRRENH